MTDDELSNFQTYDKLYRSRLFNLMHLILEGLGPKIKSDTSECVEYIISTRSHEKYWSQLIPHKTPPDEINNKHEYMSLRVVASAGSYAPALTS